VVKRLSLTAQAGNTIFWMNGDLRLNLYNGNVIVSVWQPLTDSLFNERVATFEDNVADVIY